MQQYTIIDALSQLLEEEGIPNTVLHPYESIGVIKTTHTHPYLIITINGNLDITKENQRGKHQHHTKTHWTTIATNIILADPTCHKKIITAITQDAEKTNNHPTKETK
jgi:hypothetical protein